MHNRGRVYLSRFTMRQLGHALQKSRRTRKSQLWLIADQKRLPRRNCCRKFSGDYRAGRRPQSGIQMFLVLYKNYMLEAGSGDARHGAHLNRPVSAQACAYGLGNLL
jgi:hypothetical protein